MEQKIVKRILKSVTVLAISSESLEILAQFDVDKDPKSDTDCKKILLEKGFPEDSILTVVRKNYESREMSLKTFIENSTVIDEENKED